MSIEGLEMIKKLYDEEGGRFSEHNRTILVSDFMKTTIDTFKDQSDMIAELRQELAKKMKADDQKESYYPKKEVILWMKEYEYCMKS